MSTEGLTNIYSDRRKIEKDHTTSHSLRKSQNISLMDNEYIMFVSINISIVNFNYIFFFYSNFISVMETNILYIPLF